MSLPNLIFTFLTFLPLVRPSTVPAAFQDPNGSLLDSGDLIPDQMSRLIPEIRDKDEKCEEEAQPGTGASFRFLISI